MKPHNCPCCSRQTTSVHDYRIRNIKDISAFGKYVILMHNHRRYVCKHCGKRFAEDNSFVPKYYRVTIMNWEKSILNTFDYPYTNGFTEGCNNKIKVLKRNTDGYQNFERFRKRILHMFNYKKTDKLKAVA